MRNERAVINLALVVLGLGLYWLFVKISGSEFRMLAGLCAAVFMFISASICWSAYAIGTIERGCLPVDVFLRGSWRATVEGCVCFLAICVFCIVVVPVVSFQFRDWWIGIGTIVLCVATFTVVNPLMSCAVALLLRKKYHGTGR